MTQLRSVPELLAPAGSLDAARAALANGADAIYLGAERFNARDEGAQLTLDEVGQACTLAHARGARVYLTLNTLLKPSELADALELLGEAIDCGVDAAIVQDIGLVGLVRAVYPGFEIHGSTQMTVHDAAGATLMEELGVDRIVLARENTLDDIRAIRAAVPTLGLETFVHGALCISYSGQCYMSGMISERSANRGSCAQSCRKDYVLRDAATGAVLDSGYLISAKDLGAYEDLPAIAEAGIGCLKVEGRKKRPEYVATVTAAYRTMLERLRRGEWTGPTADEIQPLVQIYSRGFTPGMYRGRAGRDYVTRSQPDNRGVDVGVVTGTGQGTILVEVSRELIRGDGILLAPPPRGEGEGRGFSIEAIRTVARSGALLRQVIDSSFRAPAGWRVILTADRRLLERARSSYADTYDVDSPKLRLDARVFGGPGSPLKILFRVLEEEVTVRSAVALSAADRRPLDESTLRLQLGRLGETPFMLGTVGVTGLSGGLFLPVSELNRLRQEAVEELLQRRDWVDAARRTERTEGIRRAVDAVKKAHPPGDRVAIAVPADVAGTPRLVAEVFDLDMAREVLAGGVDEIVLDPFLRHPAPSRARVTAFAREIAAQGRTMRLRLPTIVRPEDRATLDKWLALDLPLLVGHLGLAVELARAGRDVAADYAVNCFNPHTAERLFRWGISRVTASIELTTDEIAELVAYRGGAGFDVVLHGRPEGMTIEHCVLSAAFEREPTTCRDLCVQRHTNVELTDPTGYTFPVATDAACRNRLLHSRPIDGVEFLPRLWRAGIRSYRMIFNRPGDPVRPVVEAYRRAVDAVAAGERPDDAAIRTHLDGGFTRGHFVRAV